MPFSYFTESSFKEQPSISPKTKSVQKSWSKGIKDGVGIKKVNWEKGKSFKHKKDCSCQI